MNQQPKNELDKLLVALGLKEEEKQPPPPPWCPQPLKRPEL